MFDWLDNILHPKVDYYEYIKSNAWKSKAEDAKERAGNRCQLCHVSGYAIKLHVHHNNYERLGHEKDSDLIVLCADCHKTFHDVSRPGKKIKLSRKEFLNVLLDNDITWDNDDPYKYYERGKRIIQQMIDGYDKELYDYYNAINIEVLNAAIQNCDKRDYERAKDHDWFGLETEKRWREANDYWKGWKK